MATGSIVKGIDLSFVIDTTGSMWDDIAAVKSSAAKIIDAVFGGEEGTLDSRISVVGYNDPNATTFLSFTEQPNIEDRKTAALDAINSISVGGGGDFPEAVNTGLLRALDGSSGEWREDAAARRIVLFGDAPAKDTDLRDEVIALANDLNVGIAGDVSTEVSGDVAVTTFEVIHDDCIIPVEIFSIIIGNNSSTIEDFESLTEATGGTVLTAANASEIVGTIIDAIGLPVASPDSFTLDENETVSDNILTNDIDPDGDDLEVVSINGESGDIGSEITLESGATVTLNADGTFDYDTNGAFNGLNEGEIATDSFTYEISDVDGNIDNATASFLINGVDDASTPSFFSDNNDFFIATDADETFSLLGGDDVIATRGGNDTVLAGDGNDQVYGGDGDDMIWGQNGDDYLSGATGMDTIYGGTGTDRIYGGADNDHLFGGDDGDIIRGGEGDDSVNGQAGDDFLLSGGNGNDTIFGETGQDNLAGGNGDDVLIGGADADILYGNSGEDIFKYISETDSTLTATDTIKDFQIGLDIIELSALGLQASNFVISGSGTNFNVANMNSDFSIDVNTTGRTLTIADINFAA